MDMINVNSSTLSAIGYDADTGLLRIEFKSGAAYEYFDVPQYEHEALMSAPSHGKYANQNIFKKYRQQKVG